MHARWLIDVAALVTYHASAIVQRKTSLQSEIMNRYWLLSRQRFNEWNRTLREYRECLEQAPASSRGLIWKQVRPTIEEIFLSDVPVRCLCALAHRLEAEGIDKDSHAIANSIFGGQEDLRNRCLHLMSSGIDQPVELTFQLNRVRQSMEIWNDTLIGMIDHPAKVERYAFNKASIVDYTYSEQTQSLNKQQLRWHFMVSGCQQWIGQHCTSVSTSPTLNELIHRTIFNLMQPEWIESMGYEYAEITNSERLIVKMQGILDEVLVGETKTG